MKKVMTNTIAINLGQEYTLLWVGLTHISIKLEVSSLTNLRMFSSIPLFLKGMTSEFDSKIQT